METLEVLGNRIATTEDLQSIVRTMKALSAVSIRQYERAATALRQYTRNIEFGLEVVLHHRPVLAKPEAIEGPTIAIVFGSDHGLCGRFNEQIVDFAHRQTETVSAEQRLWLTVGARAASRLEAIGERIGEAFLLPGAVSGLAASAQSALLTIDQWRANRGAAHVLVFHNIRTDEATASPRMVQLLPLDSDWLQDLERRRWRGPTLPTLTMDPDQLFSYLVREHLFVTVYRAGAESMASEHATRLAAMQAAERNIKDHLEEMNTEFRHRRQQAITEELLDVVAGFETLRSV